MNSTAPRWFCRAAILLAAAVLVFGQSTPKQGASSPQAAERSKARAAGAVAVSPKIDPALRARAQSGAAIPVFIVLAGQPQGRIFRETEAANASLQREADLRYLQAAGQLLPNPEEVRKAAEAQDAATVAIRRQAFQAIAAAVKPEQDAMEARLAHLGAARIARYLGVNMMSAEIPGSALEALEADSGVARVFPVEKERAKLAVSVPDLGAPAFWGAGYTGQGQSVGVMDSGLKSNHPAFLGRNILSQVFLTNGSTDPCFADSVFSSADLDGHGTHVTGIVISQGSAGWSTYVGVARGLGTLYNIKVGYLNQNTYDCGYGGASVDQRDKQAALDWIVSSTPLRILNYSYGGSAYADDTDSARLFDQYADTYGLTIAVAAGNEGPDQYTVGSPGNAYNVLSVANWVSRGVIEDYSSRGPTLGGRDKPDLAAPGTNIYSTAFDWDLYSGTSDDFVSMDGTSMAAPHIAGAAALLRNAGVTNPLSIKAILLNTTDNFGWAEDRGWGYTNLNRAQTRLYNATGSLPAEGIRLYRATSSGTFYATATWNRHVSGGTSYFNDIDLHLYRVDTGDMLDYSNSNIQNVEQVSATYTGDVILAVNVFTSQLQGVASEPYAVAFNVPVSVVSGPSLSVSCTLPSSIAPGAQFTMNCNVSNTGDLPGYYVTAAADLPAGFSGPNAASLGTIAPGTFAPAAFQLTAPSAAGTYPIPVTASTDSYHGSFSGGGTFNAVVGAPCGFGLNPSSQTFPATGGTGTIAVSACPGAAWSVANVPGWITITGGASGIGPGTVNYSVAAGGVRSATLTVAGLPFQVQQLAPVAGLRFIPVTPCRVADTRNPYGTFGGPWIGGGGSRSFPVPQSACGIPASAQAYSLNVTVVPQGTLSYLTLWPTGQAQPFVSTLNAFAGGVVANAAIVPAGTGGAVSVFATNNTDVILDINGYFDSPSSPGSLAFYPANPCRIADTRNPAGQFGGPSIGTGQTRSFSVPASGCGIPGNASAYSTNITVVPPGYLGYLSTWPTGQPQPVVSTLNSWTGKIVANAAIVPAGVGGGVSLFASNTTDVVLDINGYFGPSGGVGQLLFYPVTPCRVADTRNAGGSLGGPIMGAGSQRSFPVPSSSCGIPSTAAAYSLNVTVVPSGPMPYLSAWPTGMSQPYVSTLNSLGGEILANAAIVPAGTGGAISVYTAGQTHVVLDINGYFAP